MVNNSTNINNSNHLLSQLSQFSFSLYSR